MNHESTWLYKNMHIEESCPNGCVVAFNPANSTLIRRQVEAIASELDFDIRIYENVRTTRKVLEAANQAYADGYETFFILTEVGELTDTERLIEERFDFEKVGAFAEVVTFPRVQTRLAEAMYNAQPLREAPVAPATPKPTAPTGNALLLVAALNADPPTRGMAPLLQEILDLQKNAANLVATHASKFTAWDRRTVYVRIYLRAAPGANSFDAGYRACLMADGGSFLGLYDQKGVSPNKVNPPLIDTPGGLWIPGDRRSKPMTKIRDFTANLGIGDTIVFAPASQVPDVQAEFGSS